MTNLRDVEGATPVISERFQRVGTSTLYEASGLKCALSPSIRSIWQGAVVAGVAYPVACAPGDNLGIHIALERVPKGAVLVVSTGGFMAGYWGEVLTVAARSADVAGLVIDGGVRDIAALARRKFPTFAAGVAIAGTVKEHVLGVGSTIILGGLYVRAGDWVVGDDDGVVVLPAEKSEEILAAAEARAEKEDAVMRRLKSGETTLDLMGLNKWRDQSF